MTDRRARVGGIGTFVGRSFFPLAALVVVLGAVWWGPWVSLGLAYALWRIVARMG